MKGLYSAWCVFCFGFWYVVLFPFSWIGLQRPQWYPFVHRVNRLCSQIFLICVGVSVQIEYRYRPDLHKTYVFCANHFSYLDIVVMGVILENYFAFVGKEEVKKIPLFGYMFVKMHIYVNRDASQSRVSSLSKSLKTLSTGRSVVIFPEGGIKAPSPPRMHHPFQNGAFQVAIRQQVPIVPVTLLSNYDILPDRWPLRMKRKAMRAIVHQPIETTGCTQTDTNAIREQCFTVIQEALQKNNQSNAT
ncbi:MAG: 1-acyl-sn-glycerol-3-phosphate acyltransferase [Runella slithyformis]|nr:MAG: 1-acyl-sn-glycerol-3-phosphate acyltransferase [Runella slithyformis]TAF31929.1 MAG: 1-acyl-sn-glycerol-3-phosphate acyltransferase [Cytophagales bacterium]TAF80472.1 MAG: 1-acyl-sn-glycerol-3-phosphate acyltransferase [Runella slithyformis]